MRSNSVSCIMNNSLIKSITKVRDTSNNANDDPIKQESASDEADEELTQSSLLLSNNLSAIHRTTHNVERLPSKSTVFTHNKPVQKKSGSNVSDSSWTIFTHNETYSHIVKTYIVDISNTTNKLLPTDNDTIISDISNDDAPINQDNDDDDDDEDDDVPLARSFVKLHPNTSLSALVPNEMKFHFQTIKQKRQLARNKDKIKTLQQEFKRLKQRNIELKNIIKSI